MAHVRPDLCAVVHGILQSPKATYCRLRHWVTGPSAPRCLMLARTAYIGRSCVLVVLKEATRPPASFVEYVVETALPDKNQTW